MFYPQTPFNKYPELERLLRSQNHEIDADLLSWLCRTPRMTTIRVNCLKTTQNQLKDHVEDCIQAITKKYHHLMPIISIHDRLPNVITISPVHGDAQKSTGDDVEANPNLKEVIVDVNCGAALLRGAHLYAPGVLAMPAQTKVNERVNIFADVEGLCKRGHNSTYESPKKIFVGVGVVQMQRYQLFGANLIPSGIAVLIERVRSGVPSIGDEYIPKGHGILQNFPSIVCGYVLGPKSGETVLDMCAAPGNKTTHLAELMRDTGRLVALDKTPNKLKLLISKMSEFDVKSVKCFSFDSTKALDENLNDGNDENRQLEPPFAPSTFDRILLDAPCSALGNRPQLRNDMSPKMLASYPVVQKKLFRAAVGLLKPGGVLVYSTCTINAAENEQVVAWALEKFGNELKLETASPKFGGPGWLGEGLSEEERHQVQRFGPIVSCSENNNDTVGFFIAKFSKNKL